jgi:hypothetical protein
LGGTGAGPWDQVGTDVFPDSTGWNVTIGAAAVVGSEKLRVVGGTARLEDGLTVAGGYIDLDPTGAFALDMDAGAPVNVTLGGGAGSDLSVLDSGGNQMMRVSEQNNVIELGDVSENWDFLFSGGGSFTIGTSSGNENAVGIYETSSDPPLTANVGKLYTKDVSGVTQLFYRDDSVGTVTQLTPLNDAGPWDETAGVVSTDNAAWNVVVGAATMSGSEKLRVVGDVSLSSDITFEVQSLVHNIQGTQPSGFGSQQGDGFDFIAATGQDNNAGAPGPGGLLRVLGGRGGDATSGSDNGGGGNQANIAGGFGGSATGFGQSGGTGGSSTHAGGNGGGGTGGATGGTGGAAFVHGGQGGISSLGGNGGDTYVRGGNSASFGSGTGGDAYLYGGTGTSPANHGRVLVAHNDTRAIEIGNASDNPTTDFLGTGLITVNSIAQIDPSDGGSIWGAISRHASALVQCDSTTKGFAPPRMTRDQRNLIPGPLTGLEVHNTSRSGSLDFHDGTQWREVAPPIDGGLQTGPVAYSASVDELIRCDPSLGVPTITLPTAVGVAMRAITIKEVAGSASPINVNTTGGETIDGVAGPPADTITTAYGAATYISDGSNWMKFT